MSLGLSHSLSRYKLKFSPDKVDTMVVQAIGLLDDLDKEINIYAMRVKVSSNAREFVTQRGGRGIEGDASEFSRKRTGFGLVPWTLSLIQKGGQYMNFSRPIERVE